MYPLALQVPAENVAWATRKYVAGLVMFIRRGGNGIVSLAVVVVSLVALNPSSDVPSSVALAGLNEAVESPFCVALANSNTT
jgi:hypothetical protein